MRLIDANTLKAEFTGNFNGGYYTVPEIQAHIDVSPTIDAAPLKHGKWIMMGGMKPPEYHHHHQCSVCESYAPMRMPYGTKEVLTPWCPGCGAKMDLEETIE